MNVERMTFEQMNNIKKKQLKNVKTTFEIKNGRITFTTEPNDEVYVKFGTYDIRKMKRTDAIRLFWDEIAMGDNLEIEQGALGLFDTITGNNVIAPNDF